jgi:hypothetical protein
MTIALAEALQATIRTPRRASAARMLRRAIERGELPEDTDIEIGLDFLAGPLYWRQAVTRLPAAELFIPTGRCYTCHRRAAASDGTGGRVTVDPAGSGKRRQQCARPHSCVPPAGR